MATVTERARVNDLRVVYTYPAVRAKLTQREQKAIDAWVRHAEVEVPKGVARALARVPDLFAEMLWEREHPADKTTTPAGKSDAKEDQEEQAPDGQERGGIRAMFGRR